MGSLVRLAKKIEDHKKEITRAKRKAERELKKSVSSYRRSSSSLASIERNVEAAKELSFAKSRTLNRQDASFLQQYLQVVLLVTLLRLHLMDNVVKHRSY